MAYRTVVSYDYTEGTCCLKFVNYDVIVHHNVSLQTLSYANLADITQPY